MGTFLLSVFVIWVVVIILIEFTKNPGERHFTSVPCHARADFLNRTFGITKQDCEHLRFDGRHFHHRKERPYENYNDVYVKGSKRVTVTNASLPHHVSWKHQRIDGGPDLRYRGNEKTMYSQLYLIRFEGPKPFVLHVYSYHPGDSEIDRLTKKFGVFLCGVKEKDYENKFIEFKRAYEKKQLAQIRLSENMSSIASCDAVTIAHTKILGSISISADIKAKVEEAETRRLQLLGEVELLRQEISEQEECENLAVRSAQMQNEIALSHRTITQFK